MWLFAWNLVVGYQTTNFFVKQPNSQIFFNCSSTLPLANLFFALQNNFGVKILSGWPFYVFDVFYVLHVLFCFDV